MIKTALETALNEEMTEHLGYEKHESAGVEPGNVRNGTRAKTVLTDKTGPVQINVPRPPPHDTVQVAWNSVVKKSPATTVPSPPPASRLSLRPRGWRRGGSGRRRRRQRRVFH
ncbi:transposase [Micromonospora sp. NPDC047762]|uniref:transposase n=1 Tax=Micromonospora sp. NPDC047762 TaxID=3364255 RepID=UPI0037124A3A